MCVSHEALPQNKAFAIRPFQLILYGTIYVMYVCICVFVRIYVICVVICNTLSWKICDIKIAYRRLYKCVL